MTDQTVPDVKPDGWDERGMMPFDDWRAQQLRIVENNARRRDWFRAEQAAVDRNRADLADERADLVMQARRGEL